MAKSSLAAIWRRSLQRSLNRLGRQAVDAGIQALGQAMKPVAGKPAGRRQAARPAKAKARPAPRAKAARRPAAAGQWLSGVAGGAAGLRRYRLYRPAGVSPEERLPLLVMLHGCMQDAEAFAASTRMNLLAARERFLVLYPEQDRSANPQGCWNWFDTRGGRAQREAASIVAAIDQVAARQPVDLQRVVVAGLSAGASLAALLAMLHPQRVRAVVMHSGVAPGAADSTLSALGAMRGRPGAGAVEARTGTLPPLLVIQGTQDAVVDARNGANAAQVWAAAAGAVAGTPRTLQRGRRHPMTLTDHRLGRQLVATQVDIQGLAHAWSGGAAGQPFSDPAGPDASGLLWAFARRAFAAAPRRP